METESGLHSRGSAPRPLPIVGGDLALDFANTVDDPDGPARHDHLQTYADVLAWTTRVKALSPGSVTALHDLSHRDPVGASRALSQAHDLRRALEDVFGTVADGALKPTALPAGWLVVRDVASLAMSAASLTRGADRSVLRWSWPSTGDVRTPLYPVAVSATDLLRSPKLAHVKRCARCPWLFIDTSRNHSRRWCDMNDCGRAQKIERYVARRAERRTAST